MRQIVQRLAQCQESALTQLRDPFLLDLAYAPSDRFDHGPAVGRQADLHRRAGLGLSPEILIGAPYSAFMG